MNRNVWELPSNLFLKANLNLNFYFKGGVDQFLQGWFPKS